MVANLDILPMEAANGRLSVHHTGEVRGTITGLTRSGDTSYVHLRHYGSEVIRLRVRYKELGAELESHIQKGIVGLWVTGMWDSTEPGWLPRPDECYVVHLVTFRQSTLSEGLDRLTAVAADGWNALDDPMAAWKALRGCE